MYFLYPLLCWSLPLPAATGKIQAGKKGEETGFLLSEMGNFNDAVCAKDLKHQKSVVFPVTAFRAFHLFSQMNTTKGIIRSCHKHHKLRNIDLWRETHSSVSLHYTTVNCTTTTVHNGHSNTHLPTEVMQLYKLPCYFAPLVLQVVNEDRYTIVVQRNHSSGYRNGPFRS